MKTILIVEDDKILRENTCTFLTEEGYNVVTAEDGLEGLQLALKLLPDLILCDIMMPKMDGYEFYKTIQQINSTSTIPLIFLTAKSEKEDIRAGMHLGADDYIVKPFDLNELLVSIQTRLEKMEKIIHKNDKKFYTLFDNPFVGTFIYKPDQFTFVNDKFAKIFGLDKNDFSRIPFRDLIIGNDKDMVMNKINLCLSKVNSTVHARFQTTNKITKEIVTIEIYGGVVTFKGTDSLIGNIAECSKNSSLLFSEARDERAQSLSKKELKILALVCQGHSSSDIATLFGRSKRTIETHRANIMNKTNVKNTADLVIYALRNNLIQ